MPEWNERACFGEEQEQQPIDDRERLFEHVVDPTRRIPRKKRTEQEWRRRVKHAGLERAADARGVPLGVDDGGDERAATAGFAAEGAGTENTRERGRRADLVRGRVELQVEVTPRVEPGRAHDAKMCAVE